MRRLFKPIPSPFQVAASNELPFARAQRWSRDFLAASMLCAVVALFNVAPGYGQSPAPGLTADGRELPVLRSGWYLYEPYQFIDTKRAGALSGVDVEIAQELSRRLGFHVEFAYMNWHDQVDRLSRGTIDFTEAAATPELEKVAHFTEPYRTEEIVLLMSPVLAERFSRLSTAEIIEAFERDKLKLGVVDGFSYGKNALSTYILRNSKAPIIIDAENSTLNIRNLIDGRVQAALEDRTSAINILWKHKWFDQLAEVRFRDHPHADIAIMFSKANFPQKLVKQANTELAALRAEGFIEETQRRYTIPLFLSQTTHARWYIIIDFIGTVAFALSGAILAWRYNANVAGFVLLSGLPAVGGGIMRDILLGRGIAAFQNSYGLAIFLSVALLAYGAKRLWRVIDARQGLRAIGAGLFNLCDAAGLASFTVTGVAITVSDPVSHPLVWAPFFGALTAAGGGIARDAIVGRRAGTLFTDVYVQISLVFGALLSVYFAMTPVRIEPNQFTVAVSATMLAAILSRLVWLRWQGRLFSV